MELYSPSSPASQDLCPAQANHIADYCRSGFDIDESDGDICWGVGIDIFGDTGEWMVGELGLGGGAWVW
jgi:hypothetical protein